MIRKRLRGRLSVISAPMAASKAPIPLVLRICAVSDGPLAREAISSSVAVPASAGSLLTCARSLTYEM